MNAVGARQERFIQNRRKGGIMKAAILVLTLFAGYLMISSASAPSQAEVSSVPTQARAVCSSAEQPTALSAADDPKAEPKKDDSEKGAKAKSDTKKGDANTDASQEEASDDSKAGGGTNPGTVKCHQCAIYCERYVPQIPNGYWESYVCGWKDCPPCGA